MEGAASVRLPADTGLPPGYVSDVRPAERKDSGKSDGRFYALLAQSVEQRIDNP